MPVVEVNIPTWQPVKRPCISLSRESAEYLANRLGLSLAAAIDGLERVWERFGLWPNDRISVTEFDDQLAYGYLERQPTITVMFHFAIDFFRPLSEPAAIAA